MKTVTIHEAKTHLSRLIQRVLNGEVIIIAKGKKPLVQLTPIGHDTQTRVVGDLKGGVRIAEDFDAPLHDFEKYQ